MKVQSHSLYRNDTTSICRLAGDDPSKKVKPRITAQQAGYFVAIATEIICALGAAYFAKQYISAAFVLKGQVGYWAPAAAMQGGIGLILIALIPILAKCAYDLFQASPFIRNG